MIWLSLGLAWANGQTTHVWISRHALTHLPQGELRMLLEDNEEALINGTMFPDGGYGMSPAHPYAETAHWEPFQGRYEAWIHATHGAPWSDEGARHAAFLMGLASHGMADQVFDSLYMERSKVYDADHGWASGVSMDEATDVIFAAQVGKETAPERWIPADELIPLFAAEGVEVDAKTLDDGQKLLGAAIGLVGLLSENPEVVADYEADYPWAGAHLLDRPDVPGAPRCEGAIVAAYWQEVWDRLHGTWGPEVLLQTLPYEGAWEHPREHAKVEARLTMVFARGLLVEDVVSEAFTVTDSEGTEWAVEPWLFYRDDSHVVHLIPQQDWAADQDYTVTVHAGLRLRDGTEVAEDLLWSFTTRPAPEIDTPDPQRGCGSVAAGPWLLALLAARRRAVPRDRA